MDRLEGRIGRVVVARGFGFIIHEKDEYFFHHTDLENAVLGQLRLGDLVSFEPVTTPKGLRAQSVTKLRVSDYDDKGWVVPKNA